VRVNTHEEFTKRDKTRNVENIVQRQLVELNDVDKEEPTKEFMRRNGNASEEESGECYPEYILPRVAT
jgi:hypothetical protein